MRHTHAGNVQVKVKVNRAASSSAGGWLATPTYATYSNLTSPRRTYVRTPIHPSRRHRTAGGAQRHLHTNTYPTNSHHKNRAIPAGQNKFLLELDLHTLKLKKDSQTSSAGALHGCHKRMGRCAYIYTVCVCLSAVLGRVVRKSMGGGGRASPSGTGKAVSQSGRQMEWME